MQYEELIWIQVVQFLNWKVTCLLLDPAWGFGTARQGSHFCLITRSTGSHLGLDPSQNTYKILSALYPRDLWVDAGTPPPWKSGGIFL